MADVKNNNITGSYLYVLLTYFSGSCYANRRHSQQDCNKRCLRWCHFFFTKNTQTGSSTKIPSGYARFNDRVAGPRTPRRSVNGRAGNVWSGWQSERFITETPLSLSKCHPPQTNENRYLHDICLHVSARKECWSRKCADGWLNSG